MSVAWVLNLGVEVELAGGQLGAAAARRRAEVRRALRLPEGHVVLDLDDDARARGLEGRAWCPTPSALARLAAAGARVPPAPSVEVLRRVNERSFAHELVALPQTVRCDDLDAVRAATERPGRWLLFRSLTFAGRGQRRVDAGRWDEGAEAWARGALRIGPVHVLPRVEIELEVSLHGMLGPDALRLGRPTVSDVDAAGQWRASRLAEAGELEAAEVLALHDAVERVAVALREAGYFGPFGVDAFRHAGGFHPLSEINARYSMGWPVGMGGWS
ncbi:MAG: hypothetical protein H6719_02550 [Sandaracinaceae bacterium]|nr:hypothetical protein [Sandaracinaceae bacterium]